MADVADRNERGGDIEGRKTRGGWAPAGTAAARRAKLSHGATDRGRQARGEIVAAARKVFERDGYLSARVEDIVAEAGIARGSFYTYFTSKNEVFREIAVQVNELIAEAVHRQDTSADDVYQGLHDSNRRYLEVYQANSRMLALVEQMSTVEPKHREVYARARQAHVNRVARTIQRWQEKGLADSTIDARTAASALVSMISNFAYWELVVSDDYDPRLAVETLTEIWIRAIGLRRRPRKLPPPTVPS